MNYIYKAKPRYIFLFVSKTHFIERFPFCKKRKTEGNYIQTYFLSSSKVKTDEKRAREKREKGNGQNSQK